MAKAMTKTQIIGALAEKAEVTKKQMAVIVEDLVGLAYKEAKNGFTIPGLGKLVVVNRKARLGRNPKTGETIWDLTISGPVNSPSPNAMQLHRSISGGFVQLGCSIDAFVLDHTLKSSGGLNIDGIDVWAASIVGVPANQRSWTQKAVRAIKSFHPDEEDEVVPPDVNEGLAIETEAVAKESPEAALATALDAPVEDLLPVEDAAEAAPEEIIEKSESCPECGLGADAEGCSNGYHSAEKSADENASGVQESAQETPETAPSGETEADPSTEEKAASLSPDDVRDLVHHVERLVKEIGHLREANATLTEQLAAARQDSREVRDEVELAKQVIEKVMETPLRSKTAAYVNGFKEVHRLFDPDVAAYLSKRGE